MTEWQRMTDDERRAWLKERVSKPVTLEVVRNFCAELAIASYSLPPYERVVACRNASPSEWGYEFGVTNVARWPFWAARPEDLWDCREAPE